MTAMVATRAGVTLALATVVSACAVAQEAPTPQSLRARSLAANCAACHGTRGRPTAGSSVAGLAGRSAAEIADVMAQFKEGKRNPTVMHQIAKGYSEAEIHAIANYFSRLER